MTNPCALVISVFLRPVSTRRRRWTHKEPLRNKLQFAFISLHIPDEPNNPLLYGTAVGRTIKKGAHALAYTRFTRYLVPVAERLCFSFCIYPSFLPKPMRLSGLMMEPTSCLSWLNISATVSHWPSSSFLAGTK